MECQVNVISQSELDIGGRETCLTFNKDRYGDMALHWRRFFNFDFLTNKKIEPD